MGRHRRQIREAQRRAVVVCAGLMMGVAVPGAGAAAQEGKRCDDERTAIVIEYGDVIRCAISPAGDRDLFRFVASGGETIRVQIADRTSGSATPCFRLRDPDNIALGGRACGDRGRDFLLERSGTYRIVVTEDAEDGEQTVRYTLAADRIDPTSPAAVPMKYGQQLTEQISRRGDMDAYFFDAAANDTVAIQIADRTPGSAAPCFQLYSPTGEALTNRMCGNRTEELVLEGAGRHSILVTERPSGGQREVEYRLRLSCVDGVCPSLGSEEVRSCLALKGSPFKDGTVRFIQPDEDRQIDITDVRGCAKFLPVEGKPFRFRIAGPNVPG